MSSTQAFKHHHQQQQHQKQPWFNFLDDDQYSPLQDIYDNHQQGLLLLQLLEYKACINYFKSSLQQLINFSSQLLLLLKQQEENKNQSRNACCCSCSLLHLRLSTNWIHLSTTSNTATASNDDNNSNNNNNDISFVDHNTFLLDKTVFALEIDFTTRNASSQDLKNHLNTLTAAMLSNLALAHHLFALQVNNTKDEQNKKFPHVIISSTDVLNRSLTLYNKAAEVAQQCPLSYMNSTNQRLLLSIYTNKAHVAYQVFDYQQSEQAMQIVSFLLKHVMLSRQQQQQRQRQRLHDIEEEQDLHEFYLNMLYATGHGVRSAAAA